ncbi:MAG: glycoside hydrolase family 2 TIM barrel-domain containing protein [Bacteroidales bacterium]|nr:glycoside hydrolase family 2 TIM barrel-domain containing protein [Bacteroidales bacterium]
MKTLKSIFLLLIAAFSALAATAQDAPTRGALYHIRSVAYGTVVDKGGQLKALDATNPAQHWNVAELSGSWRFICPFTTEAVRAEGSRVETGEVNGSDEMQIWKMETVKGGVILYPTNRPEVAMCAQKDGSITLISKADAAKNKQAVFAIEQAAASGFDDALTYNICSVKHPGMVLGNADSQNNSTPIRLEAADKENRGQYWNVKMLDFTTRIIGNAYYSQHMDDGGPNQSIDYLLQWPAAMSNPGNARLRLLPVEGQTGVYVIGSVGKPDKMWVPEGQQLKARPIDLANEEAWFTFTSVEKPKIAQNIWEDETFFEENKEPGIAYYTPYLNTEEMMADADFYAHPWVQPQSSTVMSLNGDWKFNFVDHPAARPLDFYKEGYDDSQWATIPVPSNWEMQGYDRPLYCNVEYPHGNTPPFINARPGFNDGGNNYGINPVGSYVRTFDLPAAWEGRRTFLRFNGIYSAALVWVNGEYVGYTQGANNVHEFDLTKHLRAGQNRLAVQVFRWSDGSYLECQDMFRMSGLYRDVCLYNVPLASVRDHVLVGTMKNNYQDASLAVTCKVDNRDLLSGSRVLKVALYDPNGTLVEEQQETIPLMALPADVEAGFDFEVKDVYPWTDETPNLYTVQFALCDNAGREEMAWSTKYGFREIKIENSLVYVNGRRMLFKGVNRHDTDPMRGRAVENETMMRDLVLMKQNNINMVRTSHYPNNPGFYAMMDQLGIWACDEGDLEDHANQTISDNPTWIPAFVDRITRLVTRDRNHPCVAMWSLGNEAGAGANFEACYNEAHRLDATRPVHYEGTRIHHPYGGEIYSDFYSKMYPGIEWMHEHTSNLDKPMFICEYAHAMGNAIGNLSQYWDIIEQSNSCIGGCIWDWVDQAIFDPQEMKEGKYNLHTGYDYPGPHQGNFCSNGVIPATREESSKLNEVKAAHQWIKFKLEDYDISKNTAVVNVRNAYVFQNLDAYQLQYEVLDNGYVVYTQTVDFPELAPGANTNMTLFLGKGFMKKADKKEHELLVSLRAIRRDGTDWCEAGHVQASAQFGIIDRGHLAAVKVNKKAAPLATTDGAGLRTFGNDKVQLVFDEETAELVSLALNGKEVLGAGLNLAYTNHRWIENDRFDKTTDGLDAKGTIEVQPAADAINIITTRTGSLCDTRIVYTVYPQGVVDVSFDFTPHTDKLRRAGVQVGLNKELQHIDYYAHGPLENYNDRLDGFLLGRYKSSPYSMMERYIKPQSTGNREGLREVSFTDNDGHGLKVETEGEVSFTAIPYTEEQLMKAQHMWELEANPYTVLHFDAAYRGVGNASCGGAPVDTREAYRVANKPYSFKLRLTAL